MIHSVYELETSKASMKAVCEHSWTHCLLTVDVQWLGGPGAFGDVLLVRATDTAGRLIYWLLQVSLNALVTCANIVNCRST